MKLKKTALIIFIATLAACLVLAAALALYLRHGEETGAWLYDEDTVEVNYAISRIAIDLASDHAYNLYAGDSEFISMLNTLSNIDLNTATQDTIIAYNNNVKQILSGYYGADMINSLQSAWSNYLAHRDATEYSDAVRAVYNEYSAIYVNLFKIRIAASDFDMNVGIWYTYVSDLLEHYRSDANHMIIQTDETGTKTSTLNIGVKLKGGTTWSTARGELSGAYYDENFNSMVSEMSFEYRNASVDPVFFNFNVSPDVNNPSGILYFLLPYGFDMITYTTNNIIDSGDYRSVMIKLLRDGATAKPASTLATTLAGYTDIQIAQLGFTDLYAIVNLYNTEYALETFIDAQGAAHNFRLDPYDDENDGGGSIVFGMLAFADYSTLASTYTGDDFDTGDLYSLTKYNLRLITSSSIRNIDLQNDFDPDQPYNQLAEKEKFIGVSNFDVEGYVYFLQDDGSEVNAEMYIENGYISIDYTNPAAVNHLARLRVYAFFRGYSPAYMRVRMVEQFTNTQRETENITMIDFTEAEGWTDFRDNDLYFYNDDLFFSMERDITVITSSGYKAKRIIVPVITGISPEYYNDGVFNPALIDPQLEENTDLKLRVSISVEAVQPNRTQAYWGIADVSAYIAS